MRLFTSALCATVAVGLLAGCSGNSLSTPSSSPVSAQANHIDAQGHFHPGFSKIASLIPVELAPGGPRAILDRVSPDKKKKAKGGAYGSQFYASKINGYEGNLKSNPAPSCTETASYPNGIAVDGKGALIDPDGGTRSVIVYKAGMCAGTSGSFSDDYGQPADASSPNANSGTIAVGNIFDTSGAGSISICTLSGGCTSNLTNSNMYEVAGVAMDNKGNCYASATNSLGTATMTYFAGCAGSGTAATGWKNTYYGGLDIDKKGNIVAIDAFTPQLWIYKGCNPTCTVVAGPFPLHGDSVFGHLNKKSTEFIAGDYANGELDVYKYSTKGLKYEYSFNNGLDVSDDVEGAAFDPRSKQ
jgi:hypothetical protein